MSIDQGQKKITKTRNILGPQKSVFLDHRSWRRPKTLSSHTKTLRSIQERLRSKTKKQGETEVPDSSRLPTFSINGNARTTVRGKRFLLLKTSKNARRNANSGQKGPTGNDPAACLCSLPSYAFSLFTP